MPLIFAYGANLDRAGMAQRCPAARVLAPARLADHRFIIMEDGYATAVPHAGTAVHGLLWDVPAEELRALDLYEGVDAGLYSRAVRPVITEAGHHEAEVYLAASTTVGQPRPGYMEAVLRAAAACGLPPPYRADLERWLVP